MNRSANRIIMASGILCTLLGVVVLIGWQFSIPALLQIVPGDVPMKYNTALGFLLCGMAAIGVGMGWNWPARFCACLAVFIGGVTLIEHVLRSTVGIDQAFHVDRMSGQEAYPGRMAHVSAICFLLSGLALLILAWGRPGVRRPFVSAALGAAVFALSLSSMAQYVLGVTNATSGNGLVEMALHTSAGFMILGFGILHASWRGWTPGSADSLAVGGFLPPVLMRPWAPIAMGCAAAALSLLVWRGLVVKQDTEITRTVELEAAKTTNDLQTKMAVRAMALNRFSHQWDIYGELTEKQWTEECDLVERDLPGWRGISMVDTTGHVKWTHPFAKNRIAIGYNVFNDPIRKAAFDNCLRTNDVAATRQVPLITGGTGFLITVPIRRGGVLIGYLTGVFESSTLFRSILPPDVTRGFAIAIEDGGANHVPFWGRSSLPDAAATPTNERYYLPRLLRWEQVREIDDFGLGWKVRIRPTVPLLEQQQSSIPGVALGLGLLFAGMVGATIHFAQTARLHSIYVSDINGTLEKEIGERLEYMRQVEIERESALKGWAEAERQAGLLVSQAQELKRSNESLSEFASIASHDLKEPLRKIQTFGDMLRRRSGSALDADSNGYLDRMTGAAQRMQILIDGLLAYSRVSTRPPDRSPVDLNELVRGVCSDLETRIAYGGGRVDCGELPTLQADPVQMRQLFQNLIGNALKFRREGVPALVTVRGECYPNGIARITVTDNGIGFEPRFADRIFRIFERLEATSRFEGTGIGLAICRTIIERHQGTITASGVPNQGATFVMELPCIVLPPHTPDSTKGTTSNGNGSANGSGNGSTNGNTPANLNALTGNAAPAGVGVATASGSRV